MLKKLSRWFWAIIARKVYTAEYIGNNDRVFKVESRLWDLEDSMDMLEMDILTHDVELDAIADYVTYNLNKNAKIKQSKKSK